MPKKAAKTTRTVTITSGPTGNGVQSKGARRRARKRAAGAGGGVGGYQGAPVALGMVTYTGRPTINGRDAHTVTVSHREYLTDIVASQNFNIQVNQPINPALDLAFPWLGSIARKYESYIFRRLEYVYEPSCSAATAGNVYMVVDYDINDALPATKSDFAGNAGCSKNQVWMPNRFVADPRDMQKMSKERFTRGTWIVGVSDYRTYDIGRLLLASDNCAAGGATIGELYVEYTVDLITPQTNTEETYANSVEITGGGAGINKTAPFGDNTAINGGLPVGVSTDTLTFNEPGEYLLTSSLTGTGFVAGDPTFTGTINSALDRFQLIANAGGTLARLATRVKVTEPGQTLKYDFTPVATTVTGLILLVSRYAFAI